ncbi:MAG: secondary thiamine-phosphate synthase enzyme YjbQ [Chloroflexota bacterium]|nr:secondary thiamine-phosphate synthase enzyme YjbQ [Chloroflexota bacterium]MDE2949242.1 secondary thiamine-phosphate synthase enzyme YjbQ [Chloroflexota bacterium]
MMRQITVATDQKTQVIDLTAQCQSLTSSVQNGVAIFHIMHTTAALILCEDDADLRQDLLKVAQNWLRDLRPFQHARRSNPNAEAHILSAFAGASLAIPVLDGKLALGSWQNILLLEMDGPRQRTVTCMAIEARL